MFVVPGTVLCAFHKLYNLIFTVILFYISFFLSHTLFAQRVNRSRKKLLVSGRAASMRQYGDRILECWL